jgi:hypothetical protein
MSAARLLFVLLSLFVSPLYAEEFEVPHADDFCPLSPSHHILSCQGTFHAHSEADLDEYLQTVATIFESYLRNARTNRAIFDSALFFSGKKIVPIFENKTRNICTDQNIDAVESVYDEEGVLIWSNPCYNPQEPGTGLSYFWFEDDD